MGRDRRQTIVGAGGAKDVRGNLCDDEQPPVEAPCIHDRGGRRGRDAISLRRCSPNRHVSPHRRQRGNGRSSASRSVETSSERRYARAAEPDRRTRTECSSPVCDTGAKGLDCSGVGRERRCLAAASVQKGRTPTPFCLASSHCGTACRLATGGFSPKTARDLRPWFLTCAPRAGSRN